MLIFGHRGAAADAPENTLAAIEEGLRQGADGVEIDVRLSLDGRVVVCHDCDFKRTAGFCGKVKKTPSEVIRTLDAGSFKGEKFRGEKVPFLSDILRAVPAGKLIQIELKSGISSVEALRRDIEDSGKSPDEIIVIAFSRVSLKRFKELSPRIRTAWINGENPYNEKTIQEAAWLLDAAKKWKFDAVDFDSHFTVTPDYVRVLKAGGIELYSWTVNDPEKASYLRDAGLTGITTDRPRFIRESLSKLPVAVS